MTWFKVDDNLTFHRKVVAAGNAAMGLWVRAGALVAHSLGDGFIDESTAKLLGKRSEIQRLLDVGLWEKVDGGYVYHDWHDSQPSAAEVKQRRRSNADRQRRWRERNAARNGERNALRNGVTNTVSNATPSRPDPYMSSNEDIYDVGEAAEAAVEAADAAPTRREEPPPDPRARRLCEHLADRVEGNGSKRPRITKKWLEAARLMLDRDGRTEDQVRRAIDWCQDHEFWRSNVMSMPKLREKYDQLRLQASRPHLRAVGDLAPRRSTTDERVAAAQALKAKFRSNPTPQMFQIAGEIEP